MRRQSWVCLGVGILAIVAMAVPAQAVTVLFIGDRDNDVPANRLLGDDAMINLLTKWGNTVIDRDDEGSGSGGGNGATAADVAAANFVIISASASSGNVIGNDLGANDQDLLNANKPIVNMEPGLADEFGSAKTGGWNGALTTIDLIASGSALLTGFAAPGPLQLYNSAQNTVAQGALFPGFENNGLVSATVEGTPMGLVGFTLVVLSEFDEGDGTYIINPPFGEGAFQDRTPDGELLFANAIGMAGGIVPEPSIVLMGCIGAAALMRRSRRRD